ncbi:MAG: VTT domain-containing protein [Crenarchaeota archaeon]|nr:VTT domain-containing protein [Thermoproteota archaeon]
MKLDVKLLLSIIVVIAIIIVNVVPRVFSEYFNQLQEAMLKGGLLGFYLLMIIQSIIAVIPAEAVLIMSGSAFGFEASSVVGTLGLMSGALINYAIGLKFGRPLVERLVSGEQLEKVEKLFVKHGYKIIFAARFIPWISFDAVSYFAGATGIAIASFTVATFLGTVPRALFYSYVGEKLGTSIGEGDVTLLNYLLLATFIAIVLLILVSRREKTSRKPVEEAGEASLSALLLSETGCNLAAPPNAAS